jgi:hypothetical protein
LIELECAAAAAAAPTVLRTAAPLARPSAGHAARRALVGMPGGAGVRWREMGAAQGPDGGDWRVAGAHRYDEVRDGGGGLGMVLNGGERG